MNNHDETSEKEMPFLDHLEELRWRLIKSIVAIVLGAVIAFFFSGWILDFLMRPFRLAIEMQARAAGNHEAMAQAKLIFLAPTEGFMVRIKLALFAGLFISLPFVFYQLWKFIAPGLLEHEKKYIPRIVFFSTLFFFLGAFFCYAVVIRYGLNFLLGYQSEELVAQISIREYLRFVTLLILTFGIVFEMPILTYFLSRMGIVTPEFMRQKRRYSIVI
ncbi:MAG: twin-arginine translocase subunit TatC, partial [Calditrichaeota bacterium]